MSQSIYFDNKELFTGPKVNQYGSHMLMTNVTKTKKSKYVNIDTKFRDEYNSNVTSDYNVTLPERITDVRSISVTNVEIPITFFNISENLGNNAMKVGSSVIIVPDGEYTLTTLVAALNVTTIDITFSTATSSNKITITADTGTFAIDFGVDSIGGFAKYNFKSRLGWLMGFRSQTYSISSSGTTTMTSEFLADLSGPRYLYLVIDEFTGNGNQKSFVSPLPSSVINKNILARIPLNKQTYPFMSVLPMSLSTGLLTDVRSYTGKVDIQKLNVQLVNENGIAMNLNGADFSFCLEIEHE
jgi:hypothetical protein